MFLFSSLPKFIVLVRNENNKVQLIFYCCLSQAKRFISVCIALFFAIHYKISLIFLALVIIDLIIVLSVRRKKSYALPESDSKDYFDKLKVYLRNSSALGSKIISYRSR